ncbi:MAG: type III pantothenate kinase [Deltaproteobacteria bacterium]|nr:type III pantothenate kinase [Deltaproteobacteria bacterium]
MINPYKKKSSLGLLAIDMGNSHTVMGLFDGEQLKKSWRITSHKKELLGWGKKFGQKVEQVVISSVVPPLKKTLNHMASQCSNQRPLWVTSRMKMPFHLCVQNPRRVGADRIVNAVGAYVLYGKYRGDSRKGRHGGLPLLIIDAGTSTTFDVVTEKGDFIGGMIAPGIKMGAEALHERCSQLPKISLKVPNRVIGKNTSAAMMSGIVLGYASLMEGLVHRIEKELGQRPTVILTGGFAPFLGKLVKGVDVVDLHLTLKGLQKSAAFCNPPSS